MKNKSIRKGVAGLLLASLFFAELSPATAYAKGSIEDIKAETTYSADRKDYSLTSKSAHAYSAMEEIEEKEALKEQREALEYTDNVIIYKVRNSKGRSSKVDSVLKELNISNAKEILADVSENKTRNASQTGNIYRATIKTDDIWSAVDTLSELEEIEYAEPELIFRTTAVGTPDVDTDPGIQEQWYLDKLQMNTIWGDLSSNNVTPGQDTIVAVIDTGVDYEHEDLQANMWVNTAELNGKPGVDDDGDGYVDDIYGISTVGSSASHSGNPMDDHGHGTHVAGIIAMTSSNLFGGAGVSYGTKIMAIKAGQSTGEFASADIAEAIHYAKKMGADVINMSFGSYGKSALIEEALQEAFSSCVLVAAAGNDGRPTSDAPDEFMKKGDMYPAAYPYVIGVMASDASGNRADFSNWDYENNRNAEYEVIAPGTEIYSTLPGNQYAKWSGTSMAAPMVSAGAAILRSKYTEKDKYTSRFIMGQLASATTDELTYIDKLGEAHKYAALNISHSMNNLPKPNLSMANTYLFDSKEIDQNNDDDGIVDAGEIIDLGLVIRNQWGIADDVTVKVDAISDGGVKNPNVEFITDTINLGSIGTFQSRDNGFQYDNDYLVGADTPIRFKIKDNTANDTKINLNITVTAKNGFDSADSKVYKAEESITFMVQRGKVLKGVISEDMTLTKDNYWIIENSLRILENATVTVEPGTQIQFWSSEEEGPYATKAMAYIQVDGKFICNGTQEEPIEMFPSFAFQNYTVNIIGDSKKTDDTVLNYVNIVNMGKTDIDEANHIKVVQNQDGLITRYLYNGVVNESIYCSEREIKIGKVENSIFKYVRGYYTSDNLDVKLNAVNTLFESCAMDFEGTDYNGISSYVNCTFLGNQYDVYNGKATAQIENPGRISTTSNKLEYLDIYEVDDKKYVLVKNWNSILSGTSDYDNFGYFNRVINSLGGSMVCINSYQEETSIVSLLKEMANRIGQTSMRVQLGGYKENKNAVTKWFNDSSYSLSRASNLEGFAHAVIEDSSSSYLYMSTSQRSYALLEFPSTVSNSKIKSFTSAAYWDVVPKEETGFYNNSILNRLLDTNTSNWLKVVTPKAYPASYNASENYWGTTNEKLIIKQSTDFDTYINLGDIKQSPWLEQAAESAYPHVTEVYLTDMEGNRLKSVGYQQVQVVVMFNRDMDPSVNPFVTFGPAAPYTDYVVEGEFMTERRWVGTVTIPNVINAGELQFRVRGGQAMEDAWLATGADWGRFSFEVNATSAEALTLQASGGENRVDLSWTQDEYPTLAGYNVYRSTTENGKFAKINSRVIPATVRGYTDKDVDAGKTYYYYFTVVDTDMNESKPSNTASGTPLDNQKPVLQHTRVEKAVLGEAVALNAIATDNISVQYVKAFYRAKGNDEWKSINLEKTSGNNYHAVIPASEVSRKGMEYYVEASDGTNITRQGSPTSPITITVNTDIVVYAVTPSTVDIEGGSTAVVSGVNFTEDMTAKLAGEPISYTFVSDKRIEFTVPAGELGKADLKLISSEGKETTFTNAITYSDETAEIQIVEAKKTDNVVKLPIVVSSKGKIKAIDLTFKADRTKFSAARFESSSTNSNMLNQISYSYNGTIKLSIASSKTINTDGVVGYLVLTPNNITQAGMTTVQLTSGELNGVSISKLIDCNVTLEPDFTISGTVRYYSNSKPLTGVAIGTNALAEGLTDTNGRFAIANITQNKVLVMPFLQGAVNNAVSAQDAAMVLKAIVEIEELSENQILAADVNGDGQVNAMDASYILQKAVGIIEGAYPGSNAEWIFTPGSRNLTLTGNASNVDFTGILLGDVTGDWQIADNNLE